MISPYSGMDEPKRPCLRNILLPQRQTSTDLLFGIVERELRRSESECLSCSEYTASPMQAKEAIIQQLKHALEEVDDCHNYCIDDISSCATEPCESFSPKEDTYLRIMDWLQNEHGYAAPPPEVVLMDFTEQPEYENYPIQMEEMPTPTNKCHHPITNSTMLTTNDINDDYERLLPLLNNDLPSNTEDLIKYFLPKSNCTFEDFYPAPLSAPTSYITDTFLHSSSKNSGALPPPPPCRKRRHISTTSSSNPEASKKARQKRKDVLLSMESESQELLAKNQHLIILLQDVTHGIHKAKEILSKRSKRTS